MLQIDDSNGVHIFSSSAPTSVGTGSYTQLSVASMNITWSGTLYSAILRVDSNNGTAIDDVYMDDFSLTKGGTPTPTPTGGTPTPMPTISPTPSPTPSSSPGTYVWKRVNQGGGGYITGMSIQPNTGEANPLIYARADVGGAYRYDFATSTWIQLVNSNSIPASVFSNGKATYQIDGICADPSNSNVVYMAMGDSDSDTSRGTLLKSTDRGNTFSVLPLTAAFAGNYGPGRLRGERIAVDPNNSNVIYVGTRNTGLWKSTDGGNTWSQISTSSVPIGASLEGGVVQVLFDPAGGTQSGMTKRIYANVPTVGIYKSDDVGATWTQIKSGTYENMEVEGGYMWTILCDATNGNAFKYDGTNWLTTAPIPNRKSCQGLMIKPGNPNVVYVLSQGMQSMYRTTDGGTTWTTLTTSSCDSLPTSRYFTCQPWKTVTNGYWMEFDKIIMDPRDTSRVWVCEGSGVLRSTDFSDTNNAPTFLHHSNFSSGIEELCATDVLSTTGGKVVYRTLDFGGFVTNNPDVCPSNRIGLLGTDVSMSHSHDINYAPGNNNLVVSVMGNDLGSGYNQISGYSTDGGTTWTRFASQLGRYGDIAICGNNINNLVWAPLNANPSYSTNCGASWMTSTLNASFTPNYSLWNKALKSLATDGSNGKVYLYSMDGNFFASTDNGANFNKVGILPGSIWCGQIKTVPGVANEIWCSTGAEFSGGIKGIYHSTDGGANWIRLTYFDDTHAIGLGKAANGATYPTLYVYGMHAGTWGVYNSTDQGVTWTQISGYVLNTFDSVMCITGDWDTYGKVYLGFGGQGFAYGYIQ